MKHKEIFILFLFFLCSCGTELDIYNWTEMTLNNYELESESIITNSDQNIIIENYAIKIDLKTEFVATIQNSIGSPAGDGVQIGNPIDSISIITTNDFTSELLAASEVRDLFNAGTSVIDTTSISEFLETFGSASNTIDSTFQLQVKEGTNIIDGKHLFNILLFMADGDTLKGETSEVTLVNP